MSKPDENFFNAPYRSWVNRRPGFHAWFWKNNTSIHLIFKEGYHLLEGEHREHYYAAMKIKMYMFALSMNFTLK